MPAMSVSSSNAVDKQAENDLIASYEEQSQKLQIFEREMQKDFERQFEEQKRQLETRQLEHKNVLERQKILCETRAKEIEEKQSQILRDQQMRAELMMRQIQMRMENEFKLKSQMMRNQIKLMSDQDFNFVGQDISKVATQEDAERAQGDAHFHVFKLKWGSRGI